MIADIFGSGTHDLSVVHLVLNVVGDPAGHTRDREQRREEIFRNAQHRIGETGVIIHVCADRLSTVLKDCFLDNVLEFGVELISLGAALLFRKSLAQSLRVYTAWPNP